MSERAVEQITRRYRDAYLAARAVVAFGGAIKALAILVGICGVLAGLAASKQLGVLGVLIGLSGAVTGVVIYIFGVLVAAQGQMQYAVLDVAVNSSPSLAADIKVSLVTASSIGAAPVMRGHGSGGADYDRVVGEASRVHFTGAGTVRANAYQPEVLGDKSEVLEVREDKRPTAGEMLGLLHQAV